MGRIHGQPVPSLFPADGSARCLLLGEAPGPRGADQSGLPFWGDRAGQPVYRALVQAGCATVPETAWAEWDGARLKAAGLRPTLHGVALGNAYPCCPSDDAEHFRAPTDRELRSPENLARLHADFARLAQVGRGRVIAMGKRAAFLQAEFADLDLDWQILPHPSSQGLLQAAPERGRGLKLADLQAAWEGRLRALVQSGTRVSS